MQSGWTAEQLYGIQKMMLDGGFQLATPQELQNFVSLGRELGRGAFGITRRGDMKVAVKIVEIQPTISPEQLQLAIQEAQLLRHLAGIPEAVTLYDVYFNTVKPELIFLMEYLPGGSLSKHTAFSLGMTDEQVMKYIAVPLINGLAKIHSRGIRHRDIKGDNIMYNHGRLPAVKYIDFGLGCKDICVGIGGSKSHISPSIIEANATGRQLQDVEWVKADVFAVGVTLWEFLHGKNMYREGAGLTNEFSPKAYAEQLEFLKQNMGILQVEPQIAAQYPITTQYINMMLRPNDIVRPTAAELMMMISPQYQN